MAALTFWGTQFLINTTIKNDQSNMKLHALKDGSFVAVWQDFSNSTSKTDITEIRAQIFNADGSKRGAEFLVGANTAGFQSEPAVTVLNDGHFLVAWESRVSGVYSIQARAFQADGTSIGDNFQVATNGNVNPHPSITALSDGGFAVAFEVAGLDIAVQSFSAALQPVGSRVLIKSPTNDWYSDPTIVALQGKYAVAFQEWTSTSFVNHQLMFNNDGTAAAGSVPFTVSATDGSLSYPDATTLSNGMTVFAWSDTTKDTDNKNVGTLKAQILNPDGTKHSGELIIQSGVGKTISIGDVTHLPGGGFAVAYSVDEEGVNTSGLYLAVFDSNGVRVAADLLIEQLYRINDIALSTLADGRVVVSWETWYSKLDNMGDGIHAQIVDPRPKAINLTGTSFNDQYIGTRFNDRLKGAAGDDRLEGAGGKDTLTGDGGKDVFVFDTTLSKRTNLDKIVDFKVRDDSIWLDNAIFTKLGTSGSDARPAQLKRGYFTTGDKAKDGNDYIVYDKAKGVLYYDADGSGAGKQVEIATLSKNLPMTYRDFFVI
jgi:Ca2+-binding RTX toxin-like protein